MKLKRIFAVLSILFGSMAITSYAQEPARLQGLVLEEDEKGNPAPLVGAHVYWAGTKTGTATDADGRFSIAYKSEYKQLVVSFVGFKADTIAVSNNKDVRLVLKSNTLDEVTVVHRTKATTLSTINPIKIETLTQKELSKAACCNLSESFETNPSVDVSFTDAVTGTRQIQMLGLSGIYTQIQTENLPFVRGIASNSGLTFIPGHWIQSIQLTKGIGSVVNGYESMTGQINVELKKPEESEQWGLNVYGNQAGRMELNLNNTTEINKNWATTTLLHGSIRPFEVDGNNDGFMDVPKGDHINLINRWKFWGNGGLEGQFGVKLLKDNREGGQLGFDGDDSGILPMTYGIKMDQERLEAFGKLGYVFPEKEYQSIGLILSAMTHRQKNTLGLNRYRTEQQTYYANLIYQSIIGTTSHKFRTGLSFLYDQYDENLNTMDYDRIEAVPGAFFEYTYSPSERFNLIGGIRIDHNNLFGTFVTPRFHSRYAITERSILRASAGRGQRTASIFAENISVLASSRAITVYSENSKAYGLDPEVAWNFGLNFTQTFELDYRDGAISIDYYRTDFENQVVVDYDHSPQEVLFYNLEGSSYSNSLQVQLDYELIKRFDLRMAWRWLDVKTDYGTSAPGGPDRPDETLERPLTAQHRAFVNLAYETRDQWKFDYTFNWFGQKRLPNTASNPEAYRLDENSPAFVTMNAQVSKAFEKGLELYVGVENLTNYKQDDPILSADQPFNTYFDSSIIWGPVFGRMVYAGLRYTIE